MNWIKTSDQMPSTGSPVLIIYRGQVQWGFFMLKEHDCAESYRWFVYGNQREWVPFGGVTHWIYATDIPLPQPPEE